MVRSTRDEAAALRPLNGRAPVRQLRELTRRVSNDAFVDDDTNQCSVPWRLIGSEVTVQVSGSQVSSIRPASAAWASDLLTL